MYIIHGVLYIYTKIDYCSGIWIIDHTTKYLKILKIMIKIEKNMIDFI